MSRAVAVCCWLALVGGLLLAGRTRPGRPAAKGAALDLPSGGWVEVEVEIDGRPVSDVWRETFRRLLAYHDRDGDGSLSKEECARLPSAFSLRQVLWGQLVSVSVAPPLRELDRDGDGKVAGAELADFYRRAGLGGVTVAVGKPRSTDALTSAILKHVGEKWARPATSLLELDTNDDELVGPGELVPGIAYPGVVGGQLLPPSPRGGRPTASWRVRLGGPAERHVLDSTKLRLELRTAPGKLPAELASARKRWATGFVGADADRDGFLDAKEAGVEMRPLLAAADRDRDGRLSGKELASWFDLQEQVAAGHVLLTVLDHGPGLFERLDADRDGSLSVRELRAAPKRARDAKGLPHQMFATVSHGHPQSGLGAAVRGGPAWFRAMDRNGDGDVSRREFLGPAEVLARLDADRDGLISPEEAARNEPRTK